MLAYIFMPASLHACVDRRLIIVYVLLGVYDGIYIYIYRLLRAAVMIIGTLLGASI
jgi:hypothetical protein